MFIKTNCPLCDNIMSTILYNSNAGDIDGLSCFSCRLLIYEYEVYIVGNKYTHEEFNRLLKMKAFL